MRIKRNVLLTAGVAAVLAFTLFMAAPAFSKGSPAPAKMAPNPKSHNHHMTYQTVPLTIQMEAGVPFHQEEPEVGKTIHSGIGWMTPFGRASYVGGIGYPEAAEYKPDYMDDASWSELFSTGLFCIYSLEDGDIYAFDGVMGGVEPIVDDDGKMDYLMNVIVGGTGRYRNANGILLGRTPGRGDAPDSNLPLVLIKIMEGYINIQVKESKYKPMLPPVGTRNPQKWPDAEEYLAENVLIPINIEMEAGRDQWNAYESGQTIIAGTGWVEPFGRATYHYGFGYTEATDELRPDFMDDPSWSTPYPTSNLCIYHLDGGDIYAYDGIVGNLAPASDDGKSDYIIEVIVGGNGIYTNATGMILGYTFGRGDAAIPEGQVLPIPLPDSIIKIMEGYIRIK